MIDRYVTGKLLKVLPKVKLPTVYIAPVGDREDEEARPRGAGQRRRTCRSTRGRRTSRKWSCASPRRDACGEARRCLRCDLDFTQPV